MLQETAHELLGTQRAGPRFSAVEIFVIEGELARPGCIRSDPLAHTGWNGLVPVHWWNLKTCMPWDPKTSTLWLAHD